MDNQETIAKFLGTNQQQHQIDRSMWPASSSNQMHNFLPINPQDTNPAVFPSAHPGELSSSQEDFLRQLCGYPNPDTPQSLISESNSQFENEQTSETSTRGNEPSNFLHWNPVSSDVPRFPTDDYMQPLLTSPVTKKSTDRPRQLTCAQGEKARIEMLNPKPIYSKTQKKFGPGGRVSQQRVADGQVKMCIRSTVPLQNINIYVQRTEEALKKLLSKGTVNSQAYGLPPVPFPAGDVKIMPQSANVSPDGVCAVICELDLDSVYKYPEEPNGCEVYKLERTKGDTYNRFRLMVQITYQDNTQEWLVPYEFVLKSIRTQVGEDGGVPKRNPSSQNNGRQRLVTYHLEAETAKIKQLEVQSWETVQHDIAYNFIKIKKEETQKFEEGDVVGFFDRNGERTVIDFLTEENSQQAHLAGVISRHAFIEGNAGLKEEEDEETDLVCIIGQIKIKVSGKVKNGDLIYASNCDRYPGTAVSQNQLCSEAFDGAETDCGIAHSLGNRSHTLLGYALESSNDPGVSLVDCLVSIVLGITTKDQKRALRDLISHVESNVESVRSHMNKIDDRFDKIRKNRKVRTKKALGLLSFLLIAGSICYIFLAPNSPYIRGRCEKGRSRNNGELTYIFHPKDTEEEHQKINGIEFRWSKLRAKLKLSYKRMNDTGSRYFLNMNRCLTGGVRKVARWLDPSPKILPINVLAVNSNCSAVYFYSRDEKGWKAFSAARVSRITCSRKRIRKHNGE